MTHLRKLPWRITALALASVLLLTSIADACFRCGRSTCRGCNAPVRAPVKAPVKKAPLQQQNYQLSPSGASLFGFSSYGPSQNQPLHLGNFTFPKNTPPELVNQLTRMFELAGKTNQAVQTGVIAALQQKGQNDANVAEIAATGNAAVAIIQSLRQPSQLRNQSFGFKADFSNGKWNIQPTQPGGGNAGPVAPIAGRMTLQQSIQMNCSACHSNAVQKGGLNLDDISAFDAAKIQAIVDKHLLTDVEADRMPKNADGTAGERLSADALMPWLEYLSELKYGRPGGGN